MKRLLYTLIIVLAAGSMGCIYISTGIKGNGISEKRTFDVKHFDTITLTGGMTAVIVQGDEYKVEVELDSNLYEFFDAYVSGGTLHTGFRRGTNLRGYSTYNIRIQLPHLVSMNSTGSGAVTITGFIDTDKEMSISQTGSGTIGINAVLKKLEIETSGSGTITAKGSTVMLSFTGSGSGNLKAFDLKSDHVRITQSGSGNIDVTVKNSLQADLSGSGRLRYKGSPTRMTIHTSGSAKVVHIE